MVYDNDTEIIMHHLSKSLDSNIKPDLVKVFSSLAKNFDGMYNIAFINGHGDIVLARDPYGFRPLVYGFNDGVFMAASESNALINCGITDYKPLKPGHLILIKNGNIKITKFKKNFFWNETVLGDVFIQILSLVNIQKS